MESDNLPVCTGADKGVGTEGPIQRKICMSAGQTLFIDRWFLFISYQNNHSVIQLCAIQSEKDLILQCLKCSWKTFYGQEEGQINHIL